MAQRTRTSASARNTKTYRNSAYVYGNVATDLSIQRQLQEEPRRKISNEARKNREKARHMSLGYVTFLLAAIFTCAVVLINYIQLQSELTIRNERIAVLESDLNNQRLANDEAYSKILSNVDLEEIKRVAIGELGMVYAQEGQIITYTSVGSDYMRQVNNTN